MVTASCSVNEDEVKELSGNGEFKRGVFCARLEALRDRQCWVVEIGEKVDLCPDTGSLSL